jgi:hypothetical protein
MLISNSRLPVPLSGLESAAASFGVLPLKQWEIVLTELPFRYHRLGIRGTHRRKCSPLGKHRQTAPEKQPFRTALERPSSACSFLESDGLFQRYWLGRGPVKRPCERFYRAKTVSDTITQKISYTILYTIYHTISGTILTVYNSNWDSFLEKCAVKVHHNGNRNSADTSHHQRKVCN